MLYTAGFFCVVLDLTMQTVVQLRETCLPLLELKVCTPLMTTQGFSHATSLVLWLYFWKLFFYIGSKITGSDLVLLSS